MHFDATRFPRIKGFKIINHNGDFGISRHHIFVFERFLDSASDDVKILSIKAEANRRNIHLTVI
jgi:hypothetical protein